jgi:hypothetical protein
MIAIFVDNKGFKKVEILPDICPVYFFRQTQKVTYREHAPEDVAPSDLLTQTSIPFGPYQKLTEVGGESVWEYREL